MASEVNVTQPRRALSVGGSTAVNGSSGAAAFLITAALAAWHPFFRSSSEITVATSLVVMGLLNVIFDVGHALRAKYLAISLALMLSLPGCYLSRISVEDAAGRDESVWALGVGVSNMDATLPKREGEESATLRNETLGVDEIAGKIWEHAFGTITTIGEVLLQFFGRSLPGAPALPAAPQPPADPVPAEPAP